MSTTAVVPETTELSTLSDGEVLRAVAGWAQAERRATARLLRHLGELDARRLYLGAGCASTFAYCTEVLRMSEPAAYHRITAARAGRRFPELLARLASGDLHLSAICLLAPELTGANAAHWIARASGQSKRAIERMLVGESRGRGVAAGSVAGGVAGGVAPRAVALPLVESESEQAGSAPLYPAVTAPAAASLLDREVAEVPERKATPAVAREPRSFAPCLPKLSFIADPDLQDLLSQARDLVSHRNPSGDLATLLRLALRALIANTERRRFGQRAAQRDGESSTQRAAKLTAAQAAEPATEQATEQAGSSVPPSAESNASPAAGAGRANSATRRRAARWRSRYIPIAVRRAVWERDAGCCAFVSREGHRCATRAFLQFHHRIEFARGGKHTVENLALRCGAHNRYEARSDAAAVPARAREAVRVPVRRSNENSNFPRGQCAPDTAADRPLVLGPGQVASERLGPVRV